MLVRTILRNVLPIMMGTAIYAFGLHYFVISNQLMEGGVTGVALILNYAFGLPPSLMTFLLNVPLFVIGWTQLDRLSMIYTMLGTLSLSFFLWIMEILIGKGWLIPFTTDKDFFLATLYAGITIGIGLGIVFKYGGTTGGSDIIARIGNRLKGWRIGKIIFIVDAFVIGSSLFYIPREKVLYTLVAVFIASKMIDFIQEGSYAAKAFTIISDSAAELSAAIVLHLERGVTVFSAKGGYSHNPKQVLYCVVYRHEVSRLKRLIKTIDARAFIIVNEVHDVIGEGFQPN